MMVDFETAYRKLICEIMRRQADSEHAHQVLRAVREAAEPPAFKKWYDLWSPPIDKAYLDAYETERQFACMGWLAALGPVNDEGIPEGWEKALQEETIKWAESVNQSEK